MKVLNLENVLHILDHSIKLDKEMVESIRPGILPNIVEASNARIKQAEFLKELLTEMSFTIEGE